MKKIIIAVLMLALCLPVLAQEAAPAPELPALLTSVGQSADVSMIKVVMDRLGASYSMNALATPDDIGENKTLILVVGGSSKGLGAAGIDADQELQRVNELIAAAQEAGLYILVMHVGGEARRGELSDKFIAPCFEAANHAIIVSSGDKDGLMAGLVEEKGIVMDVVDTIVDTLTPIQTLFGIAA